MLDYEAIQTPITVWESILKMNPIEKDNIFLEPFAGENSLFDLVECIEKDWCEITKGKNIFDYDFQKSNVTCIYTNPPYVADIPNKKGEFKSRNSVYYFLELFMNKLTKLKKIGFIMNMKCFNSLTPKRLAKLKKIGFTITNITLFNCNFWYGLQLFVLFERDSTNKSFQYIENVFTRPINNILEKQLKEN